MQWISSRPKKDIMQTIGYKERNRFHRVAGGAPIIDHPFFSIVPDGIIMNSACPSPLPPKGRFSLACVTFWEHHSSTQSSELLWRVLEMKEWTL